MDTARLDCGGSKEEARIAAGVAGDSFLLSTLRGPIREGAIRSATKRLVK